MSSINQSAFTQRYNKINAVLEKTYVRRAMLDRGQLQLLAHCAAKDVGQTFRFAVSLCRAEALPYSTAPKGIDFSLRDTVVAGTCPFYLVIISLATGVWIVQRVLNVAIVR